MCVCVCVCVPSGEVMVEDRGSPVQDDWSMAPDEERVKFSLSGVTPHCKTKGAEISSQHYVISHTQAHI